PPNGRELPRTRGPRQQPARRHRRAALALAGDLADRTELADAGNVDENGGLAPAQVEHGQQGLPAGKDARVVAVLGEDRQRLLDRIRPDVVERSRLHPPPPAARARPSRGLGSASAMSVWIGRGVAGSCTSFMPTPSPT